LISKRSENMKKVLFLFSLVSAVLLFSVPAFSQCATSLTYVNANVAGAFWTGNVGDPQTGAIGGVSLVVGKGNIAIGSGTDSGIYPMSATACSGSATCQARIISPNFRISAGTAQGTNAWDACPLTTDNMTVIMWEKVSEGATTHYGQFAAATAVYGANWGFSNAMTPQNNKVFQQIPVPTIISSVNDGGGNWHFTLRITIVPGSSGFTNNTNFKRQYYDSTIGAPPVVITGWRVYRFTGAAPTTGDITTGGWVYMGTQAIADDANLYTDYTTPSFALSATTRFAVTPQFADGFYPFSTYGNPYTGYFVGGQSIGAGPTGSGVFSVMNAVAQGNTINVTWTSNSETGVMGYQVYYATTTTGPYKATGASITPLGNGHNYATSFNMPATKAGGVVYVKVAANMNDSTQTWSDVKKVKYGFGPERNN
jgi:hypothetical protein